MEDQASAPEYTQQSGEDPRIQERRWRDEEHRSRQTRTLGLRVLDSAMEAVGKRSPNFDSGGDKGGGRNLPNHHLNSEGCRLKHNFSNANQRMDGPVEKAVRSQLDAENRALAQKDARGRADRNRQTGQEIKEELIRQKAWESAQQDARNAVSNLVMKAVDTGSSLFPGGGGKRGGRR